MKSEDRQHLRELAEMATRGPYIEFGKASDLRNVRTWPQWHDFSECSEADQDFIFAANPDTVIELLDRIDELEGGRREIQPDSVKAQLGTVLEEEQRENDRRVR